MNLIGSQLNTGLNTQRFSRTENQLSKIRTEYENPTAGDKKRLKGVAQELESVFFQQLLNAMDKTVDRENSMFKGGQGEQVFREMLNQHISTSASSGPAGTGLGLAQTIYRQMSAQMDQAEADELKKNKAIEQKPSSSEFKKPLNPSKPSINIAG